MMAWTKPFVTDDVRLVTLSGLRNFIKASSLWRPKVMAESNADFVLE